MKSPLQIYAAGEHWHHVTTSLPDLKPAVQEATGKPFRRIGRFIQLALIGAARCAKTPLPAETAVYFASSRGDLEVTLEIMTQLFRAGQTPKPLNFVNTVSNAACFYIAQTLQLAGRSSFVCNLNFAFERAVHLAALDLQSGKIDSALTGSVDIATLPLAEHRLRLQVSDDIPIGEGSHWLWLGMPDASRPKLGELHASAHFATRDDLQNWLDTLTLNRETSVLSFGHGVGHNDRALLQQLTSLPLVNDVSHRPFYGSVGGGTVVSFLTNRPAQHLLYINADAHAGGRYFALHVTQ